MASFFSSAGSFLITVLASVFVFGIVIFIHELGHFLTAKFSGIQVNEFALGMGPTLFSFTRGGTKYGLRLFPSAALSVWRVRTRRAKRRVPLQRPRWETESLSPWRAL